jgi:hypothetical protein
MASRKSKRIERRFKEMGGYGADVTSKKVRRRSKRRKAVHKVRKKLSRGK